MNNATTKTKTACNCPKCFKWRRAVTTMSQMELCGEMAQLAEELTHVNMESDTFASLTARIGNICAELTTRGNICAEFRDHGAW